MTRVVAIIFCFVVLILSDTATASEFPTGKLVGVGFKVQQGGRVVTDKDMHRVETEAEITSLQVNKIEMVISISIWRAPTSIPHRDRRRDVFLVKWENNTSGSLVNQNSQYSGDQSTFRIEGGMLVIKSWIVRNNLWETHFYEIP